MTATFAPGNMRVIMGTSAVALCTTFGVAAAQTAPAYHIVRQMKIGADGRRDAITVDTACNRLFITRQTRVMVIDPATGKLLGKFPVSMAPTKSHWTTVPAMDSTRQAGVVPSPYSISRSPPGRELAPWLSIPAPIASSP
jgi:hypothetical protein